MPEAYSYMRYSTLDQGAGNSIIRQTERRDAWLRKHPEYVLNRNATYKDEGLSGTGEHLDEGALGAFLKAVVAKRIKSGSVLLVEAFDRLGRMEPVDHLEMLLGLCRRGITVVTLVDGEEYSRESLRGPGGTDKLRKSLARMEVAHEESLRKGTHSQDNWNRIRSGEKNRIGTKCMPGWITVSSDGQKYELVPERAKVVREIFELTLAGWGKDKIAKKFREDGIETWGVGRKRATRWRNSYIAKILANPAVIGQHQWYKRAKFDPEIGKKVRKPIGDPIENYYPAAIKHSLWTAVQKIREGRAKRLGPIGKKVRNLFTGLVYCGHTGDTMSFANKTPHYYIKSSALKAPKGILLKPWVYENFESAFFDFVGRLDPNGLVEPSSAPEREALLEQIAEMESSVERLTKKIQRLVEVMDDDDVKSVPELQASFAATKQKRDAVNAQIVQSRQRLESLTGNDVSVNEALASIKAIREKRHDLAFRLKLRDYLAGLVDGIFIYLDGEAVFGKGVRACFNLSLGGKAIDALRLRLEQTSGEKKRAPDNSRNAARVRAFSIAFKTGMTRTVIVTQKRNGGSYAYALTGKRTKIVRENRLTKLHREDDQNSTRWMWADAINLSSSDFETREEYDDFLKSYQEAYPLGHPPTLVSKG
jgi:DNA invertase Pin-like site-specific DNA recombinase